MDLATLSKVMGYSCSTGRYEQLLPAFNRMLANAECITVPRVAMVCAQVGTESNGLAWMTELASGAEYEGRRELGNIHKGDGVRYKGRGPLQCTGLANYRSASRYAYAKHEVPTPTYFVDHPEALADDAHGFTSVEWYWWTHNMNRFADAHNVLGATRAVNGGTNGLRDRTARWVRALRLGEALLPVTSQRVTLKTDAAKKLQTILGEAADGIIGPLTLTAWQRRMGTYADGVVSGPTSSLVTAVQSWLNGIRGSWVASGKTAPYEPLVVDGVWGPATGRAVEAYLLTMNGGFKTGH